jgi:hypothetical protein
MILLYRAPQAILKEYAKKSEKVKKNSRRN